MKRFRKSAYGEAFRELIIAEWLALYLLCAVLLSAGVGVAVSVVLR